MKELITTFADYPALISVRSLASALNISQGTIRTLIKSGELPSVKIGKITRVPRDGMIAYLENHTRKGA